MNDTSQFIVITTVVSVFSPYLMDLFNYYVADKILREQVKKSAQFLATNVFGVGIAFIINVVGSFGATAFEVFLIGSGVSQTVGQLAFRARKAAGPVIGG